MIIDESNQQMQIEPRDWNYFMEVYATQYRIATKGKVPKVIVFPMFSKLHNLPVEWVPEMSEIAVSIISDGSNVPEATPEEESKLDANDKIIAELHKQIVEIENTLKASKELQLPDRKPKLPAHPISPTEGVHVDGVTGSRALDLRQVAADLQEREIDENKQKPIEVSRDTEGKRIIK
jgi:hypothetical protein